MAVWLKCKKGHRWKPIAPADVWPPEFRRFCPACGDGPIGWYMPEMIVAMLIGAVLPALVFGLGMFFFGNGTERVVGVIGALILPVVTTAVMGVLQRIQSKRTKQISVIAAKMGFTLVPLLYPPKLEAVAPFRLLPRIALISDAMQGCVGDRNMLVFDYQWSIVNGKMVQEPSKSVVILFDGAAGTPDFVLAPQSFFDKEPGLFRPYVVALEGAEEFAKRFVLAGSGEAALRRMFHPELVRRLEQDGPWFIEAANEQLLLYRTPKVAQDVRPGLVTDALEIYDLLRWKSTASL